MMSLYQDPYIILDIVIVIVVRHTCQVRSFFYLKKVIKIPLTDRQCGSFRRRHRIPWEYDGNKCPSLRDNFRSIWWCFLQNLNHRNIKFYFHFMAFSFKPHRHLNVKKGLIDFLIGPRPKQSSPLCTGWGGERSQGEDDEWWSRVPGHIVITINQHQHWTGVWFLFSPHSILLKVNFDQKSKINLVCLMVNLLCSIEICLTTIRWNTIQYNAIQLIQF